MARKDPLRNFRFRLEINGIQQAGFSECSGFDITVDPIDYREGSDPTHVRKLTGLTKFGNVTLKWGITDSKELYDWHRRIVDGTIDRKNIAIVVVAMRIIQTLIEVLLAAIGALLLRQNLRKHDNQDFQLTN